jgi:mono/diheme cytochrome c family protein
MLDAIAYYQIFGFPVLMYTGIGAFLFLLFTAIVALRRKHGRFSMKWHHRMAIIAIIVALVHGMMGLLSEGVIRTGISQKPAKSEETAYGTKIFRENCVQCHPRGGNLINPAKTLKGSEKLTDFNTFLSYIRNTKGMMPSFSSGQISDEEAMALYHYIISAQDFN